MSRDIAIALSLANLCFLKVWFYVNFTLSINSQYHRYVPPNTNHFLAVILNILLLAAFFWIAITIARKSTKKLPLKIAKGVFILTLTIPINIIHSNYELKVQNNFSILLFVFFILILLILSIRMFLYYRSHIINLLVKSVLIVFPFFILNLSQTALIFLKINPSDFLEKPSANIISVENQTSPRILWIIFDEMDQYLTFEGRPISLKLPEIDHFRSQSFYANNAYPPAGETDLSLPSLITGKIISKFEVVSPNETLLTLSEDNQTVGWSKIPNVFSKAYETGSNTALIGCHHPYSRVIGNSLTSCTWRPYEIYRQVTFSEAMAQQIELFIKFIPLINKCEFFKQFYVCDELKQKDRIKSYLEILNESKKAVVNPELGLILIHIPAPHPPGFYEREGNVFSLNEGGYLDNLALTDHTLGELRSNMENSNTWDSTTVIISSDHWLRTEIWSQKELWINENDAILFENEVNYRVPFMIKLAGQKETVNYNQAFNTVLTHDLILALLNNELFSPDDVVKWVDSKRSVVGIPDY